MRNIFKKLFCLVAILCLVTVASCESGPTLPKLDAPVVTLEDKTIKWEAITDAVSYVVYVDGKKVASDVTVTIFDLASKLTESGEYSITVVAVGDGTVYANSKNSNQVKYVVKEATKLSTPVASLDGTTLSWAEVANANGYNLYVDGKLVKENLKELSLDVASLIKEYGSYKLTVVAVGDVTNYVNSNASKEVVYQFVETVPGNFEFTSASFVKDGMVKSLKVTGDAVPAGYTLSYVNNDKVEQGKYQVQAVFRNSKNQIVESYYAILTIDNPEDEEFEEWTDVLLGLLFEGDQLSINFFFNNPETYGIPHYEAELSRAYFGDYDESMQDVFDLLVEMEAFDYDNFSFEEKDTYDIIYNYFDQLTEKTENMSYMTNGYLGSYLGYQCNIPLELAEYKFRNVQDVEDWIAYCVDAEDAFHNYFEYCEKQIEKGYAMPDFVIDNVVSQCKEFVDESENHYLIGIFNDKVDEVSFLTEDEKVAFKAQALAAIQGELTEAYRYIQDNLPTLKGKATVYGGLALYDGGKEYYVQMLRDETGYADLTAEAAIAYVDGKLKETYDSLIAIYDAVKKLKTTEQAQFQSGTDGYPAYSDLEPVDLLASFKELASAFVPELAEMPNITVKLVPESLQESYSPASYYISPMDETNKETIYLNPKYLDDKNYIYTTLAHEGYPGHLYQNVYTKSLDINNVRRVIRCSGYTEGWATYMELNSYEFVTNYTSQGQKYALKVNKLYDILNGLISVRLDLGIHYEGWTAQQTANHTNEILGYDPGEGPYNIETVKGLYEQLIEIPTNSVKYFYSYCKLDDMRTNAKNALGALYNEVGFNTVLLNYGAMPLGMLEEKVDAYIDEVLFLNGKK